MQIVDANYINIACGCLAGEHHVVICIGQVFNSEAKSTTYQMSWSIQHCLLILHQQRIALRVPDAFNIGANIFLTPYTMRRAK